MSSTFVEGVLARLKSIAEANVDAELSPEVTARLVAEVELHEASLREMFELRKVSGPPLGMGDSDEYFSEKVGKAASAAIATFDPNEREGASSETLLDQVSHYSHLVRNMLPENR